MSNLVSRGCVVCLAAAVFASACGDESTKPEPEVPRVVGTVPVNGAVGIAVDAPVRATFDRSMDPSALSTASFVLVDDSQPSVNVTGTVVYDDTNFTATFTPGAPLAHLTAYTATIDGGVSSAEGVTLADPVSWGFVTVTEVDTDAPTVVSRVPADLATDVATSTVISATFSEAIDTATLTATTFTVSGATGAVTYESGTFTTTFTPATALPAGTVVVGRLTTGITDVAGNALAADEVWSFTTTTAVDTDPPTVISKSPVNLATDVATDSIITATFSEAIDPSTLTTTTFTASAVSGAVSYDSGTFTATLTPDVPLGAGVDVDVRLTTGITDVAGNPLTADETWTFTTAPDVDTDPPTVVSKSPVNLATDVATDAFITATFSEAINAATLTAMTFTVSGATGAVTYDSPSFTATFAPTSALPEGTVVTATLTTGIRDVAGNTLAADEVWSFTTVAETDPPTVDSTSPGHLVTGVSRGASISATFSEPMDALTIDGSTFTVLGIAGAVIYEAGTNTATFTPDALLPWGEILVATIDGAVTDSAGNALGADHIWSFEVEADVLAPVITGRSPGIAETDIPRTAAVSVTFDEPLDVTALDSDSLTVDGVQGSLEWDDITFTLTFTPSDLLDYDTEYTATVSSEVVDLFGNTLGTDDVWSFTTVSCPDGAEDTEELCSDGCSNDGDQYIDCIDWDCNGTTVCAGYCPGGAENTEEFCDDGCSNDGDQWIDCDDWDCNGTTVCGASTAPFVVDHWPSEGQEDVDRDPLVRIIFSEAMAPGTINSTNITITGGGTVAYDDVAFAASITVTAPFDHGEVVTVTVTTAVTDAGGTALLTPVTFGFTVITDDDPPYVVDRDPLDGATDVATDVVPTLSFNESLDPATVSALSIRLERSGTPVAATVTYDDPSRTVTVTPSALLEEGAVYQVVVAGVTDLAGNPAAGSPAGFETVAETTPPAVVATSPDDDTTDVAATVTVTMTFDDDLDPATVTSANFLITECNQVISGIGFWSCSELGPEVATDPVYDPATRIVTINHDPLDFDQYYVGRATTDVADTNGNPMATFYTFDFQTGVDPAGPSIVEVRPADGARFVSTGQTLRVTFDKSVNPATLTGSTLFVAGHATTISYNDTTRIATVTPTTPWDPATGYTLSATTGITDSDGDPLMAAVTSRFRTLRSPQVPGVTEDPDRLHSVSAWTDSGEGVAAWVVDYGDAAVVRAAIYGSDWEAPETLGPVDLEYLWIAGGDLLTTTPGVVALANADSVLLAWYRGDGIVETRLHVDGGGWGPSQTLSLPSGRYALATDGNMFIAVRADSSGTWSRLHDGTGWLNEVRVSDDDLGDGTASNALRIAGGGAGFAVWDSYENFTTDGVRAFTGDGTGWTEVVLASWSPERRGDLNAVVVGPVRYLATYYLRSSDSVGEPWELRAVTFNDSGLGTDYLVSRAAFRGYAKQAAASEIDRFAVVWRDYGTWAVIFSGPTVLLQKHYMGGVPLTLVSDGTGFAALTSTADYRRVYRYVESPPSFALSLYVGVTPSTLHGSDDGYAVVRNNPEVSTNAFGVHSFRSVWSWEPMLDESVDGYSVSPRGTGFVVTYETDQEIAVAVQETAEVWHYDTLDSGPVETSARDVRLARAGAEAMAVWRQFYGGVWRAYASHFRVGAWSTPEPLGYDIGCLDVASNGDSFVAILQYDAPAAHLVGATLRQLPVGGNTWTSPSPLDGVEANGGACVIESDGSGYLAVFTSKDVDDFVMSYARSNDGVTWEPAVQWTGITNSENFVLDLTSDGNDYFLGVTRDDGIWGYRWNGAAWVDSSNLAPVAAPFVTAAGGSGALVVHHASSALLGDEHDGSSWNAQVSRSGPGLGAGDVAWNGAEYVVVTGDDGAFYTHLQGGAWSGFVPISAVGNAAIGATSTSSVVVRWDQPAAGLWAINGSAMVNHNPLLGRLMHSASDYGRGPGELEVLGGVGFDDYVVGGTIADPSTGAFILRLWHGL